MLLIQSITIFFFFFIINNASSSSLSSNPPSATSNHVPLPISTSTSSQITNNNNKKNKPYNAIIIGGSSGMGKATAISIVQRGGNVLIVSRNQEKLNHASKEIIQQATTTTKPHTKNNNIGNVETAVLDVTNEEEVFQFTTNHLSKGKWDSLVFSAANKAPHGPIQTLPTSQTRELFETKFWGAYLCAKYISPYLNDGGCIVFVSGVLNRRPGLNCSPLASTNGALEGLTRALALELGPRLRVNCLSPGFCNTERFDHMDEKKKDAMLRNTAESLPLKRVGMPVDMGESIYFLLTASFCTGIVLDCDGGHHIRQYANKSTDPFRKED